MLLAHDYRSILSRPSRPRAVLHFSGLGSRFCFLLFYSLRVLYLRNVFSHVWCGLRRSFLDNFKPSFQSLDRFLLSWRELTLFSLPPGSQSHDLIHPAKILAFPDYVLWFKLILPSSRGSLHNLATFFFGCWHTSPFSLLLFNSGHSDFSARRLF